jgi:hypothetical protein
MSEYYATEHESTYENFIAKCPHCGFINTYNRVTDLKTIYPISYMEVRCQSDDCFKKFSINGDILASSFQYLINDCYDLIKRKRYMYCILNMAQAYEAFFGLYLKVELIIKPYKKEKSIDLDKLNRLVILLFDTIEKYTFNPLRNIFINTILLSKSINSLKDSEKAIMEIVNLCKEPSNESIQRLMDNEMSSLLLRIKQTNIGKERNLVVHKLAYRPSLEKVNQYFEETKSIFGEIDKKIGFYVDDINMY